MPDIYGAHFTYDGVSSRNYKLIIANVDTERSLSLSGQTEVATIFNKTNKQRLVVGNNYANSPMAIPINILTDDNSIMDRATVRAISRWLFDRQSYKRLSLDPIDVPSEDDPGAGARAKELYINCRFSNPQRLEYFGGTVGFTVTMETDSGWWWQEATIKDFTFTGVGPTSTNNFVVTVDSDYDDYIYPLMTIRTARSGDVSLKNNSDGTYTTAFINIAGGSIITISGRTNYINSQYYERFKGRHFPRLINGDNNFTVTGAVSRITVEFENRRLW